jgi:hypothetical protein
MSPDPTIVYLVMVIVAPVGITATRQAPSLIFSKLYFNQTFNDKISVKGSQPLNKYIAFTVFKGTLLLICGNGLIHKSTLHY